MSQGHGGHDGLAFFGAISASLSHELKNVLATINEYTSLVQDLQSPAARKPLTPERLQSICARVLAQVTRGEELIRRLNRFAHSADVPEREVDVVELVGLIADLCGRFATLQNVTLERDLPPPPLPLTVDPFALEHAVYLAIRLALDAAAGRRRVTVSLRAHEGGCRVRVASEDPLPRERAAPALAARLERAAAAAGAVAAWAPGAEAGAIELTVPGR